MNAWEERGFMVKVANLYYFGGWTQSQISKKMGISRSAISKVLQKARDEGIVEIYIKDENAHIVELGRALEDKYDLKEAIVVPTAGLTNDMIKKSLGKAAAYFVSKNLADIENIGISSGNTLASFVNEFPYNINNDLKKVIPLVGGMGKYLVDIQANILAYKLSQKLNCCCSYLYAPAIVETEDLKESIVETKDIASVLHEGKNVDMAIVGIGNPYKESTMSLMGYLKEEDKFILKKEGVVGDIGSYFYDSFGQQVKHSINNRVIGLDLDHLQKIPYVIGIVEGVHKVDSIEAALKANYFDVIALDDSTAYALLYG